MFRIYGGQIIRLKTDDVQCARRIHNENKAKLFFFLPPNVAAIYPCRYLSLNRTEKPILSYWYGKFHPGFIVITVVFLSRL